MNTLDFLTRLPIASQMSQDTLRALAAELEPRSLSRGTVLFAQGDTGDALYLVVSGKLQASVCSATDGRTFVSIITPGQFVGEMALLTNQPRSATVTALENSELLCLKKSVFERIEAEHPDLLAGLASQLLPRFERDQTRRILKNLFGDLDDALLLSMLEKMDCGRLHSGEVLFFQGEPGDEMYIVIQGRLRMVVKDAMGAQRTLGEVGAGECIGEFVLLAESGTPESLRTATVYATRLTDYLVIRRPVFEELLRQYPQAMMSLTRQIVRRSASISKPVPFSEDSIVITLLPLCVGQPLADFTEQLTHSLNALGATLFIDAARFDQMYGKPGASSTPLDHPLSLVINAWLDEREREHKFTLYETASPLGHEGKLTSWAQRCLEDADIILLVADADDDPNLTEIEKALAALQTRARLELVLRHPAERALPSGTARWLAVRHVQAHYHVRNGCQSDFRRMARRVAGKPVGLTLAGGGARGWAHLGVLRALEEANIEVDWVAGASMGSIVAAGSALGWSSEKLCELATTFSNPKKLLDYTFPYASLTSTRYITALLQELYAGNIEDTWRPYFCVSADVTYGRERMHTSGPLWKAVRASMAFPGIFAPVLEDGCVLIDGGAANNLPIDRMREMCPTGTVIGVDLVNNSPVNGKYDFGPSLSGWQALASRLPFVGRKINAPTLIDIVGGIVYSACYYHLNEVWRSADLLIKVPVQAYDILDFDKYAEVIEIGYRAAQEQLKGFVVSR
ncbi:MAG TPA: cyclic nucleotide-binding domain-containing protein [Anaerolineales bacterium]|nr:cyclic nucleotide-binding domain-containing protein [Anaerolineales bacterium]